MAAPFAHLGKYQQMKYASLVFTLVFTAIVGGLSPSEAYTGSTFIEGTELLSMCAGIDEQGNAKDTMAVGCSQFVIGVHDTMSTLTFGGLLQEGFVCFPRGIFRATTVAGGEKIPGRKPR